MSTAPTRGTRTRRQVLRTTAFAAAGLAIAACAPPSGGVAKPSRAGTGAAQPTTAPAAGGTLAGQASFTDPGVVEAGRRMQELAKAEAFPEGFNGLDYDTGGSRQLMYAGKVALELQTSSYPATTGGAADRGGGPGRRSTGPPGGGRRAGRRGHQHRASFRADSIWCTSGGPGTRQRPARRRTQQQAVTRMAGVRSPPPTV